MTSRHQEWFDQWVRRWAQNATEAIRQYQNDVAELRDQLWGASDPVERASIEELIGELEDAIASIQQQYHQWQRRAKRRLNLDLDNLAA
jgi:hypothetical protein